MIHAPKPSNSNSFDPSVTCLCARPLVQLVKCGFAGDSFPRAVFPCLVGRPTFRLNDPFSQQQSLQVGCQWVKDRGLSVRTGVLGVRYRSWGKWEGGEDTLRRELLKSGYMRLVWGVAAADAGAVGEGGECGLRLAPSTWGLSHTGAAGPAQYRQPMLHHTMQNHTMLQARTTCMRSPSAVRSSVWAYMRCVPRCCAAGSDDCRQVEARAHKRRDAL